MPSKGSLVPGRRARYGDQIVYALSRRLTVEFGDGFSVRNLWNMIRFAETFDDARIVHAMRAQLSWTHLRRLIYVEDPLARDFHAEMCRVERWNTRTLAKKIQGMLSERTALSRKPAQLIRAVARQKLLELEKSGIRVAAYWLEEIPRRLLEEKLHEAIRLAQSRVDAKDRG